MAGRVWVGVVATGALALFVGAAVGGNLGAGAATAVYEPQVAAAQAEAEAAAEEAVQTREEAAEWAADAQDVNDQNQAAIEEQNALLESARAERDDYRENLLLAIDERDAAIAEADRGWALYDEAYDTGLSVDGLRIETLRRLLVLADDYNALVDESNLLLLAGRELYAEYTVLVSENGALRSQHAVDAAAVLESARLVCQFYDWYTQAVGQQNPDRAACTNAGFERDALLDERNAAIAQRDAALRERDEAIADRDAALRDADAVILAERDALLAEVERLTKERDAAVLAAETAVGERATALTDRDAAIGARSVCQADFRAALASADHLSQAIDLLWLGDVDGSDAAIQRALEAAQQISGTC